MLHKKIKASIQSDTGIFRLFRDQTELNFSQLEVVYIFGLLFAYESRGRSGISAKTGQFGVLYQGTSVAMSETCHW